MDVQEDDALSGTLPVQSDHILPYLFLAATLVLGLLLYEKRRWRLGGVLVVPLLVLYAVTDLLLLVVFSAASAIALATGVVVRRFTFLYGRRMLYAYLLAGLLASGAMLMFIPTVYDGVVLTVLPGIFAYNVHRVGEQGLAIWRTMGVLIPLTILGILLVGAFRVGPVLVDLPFGSSLPQSMTAAAIGLQLSVEADVAIGGGAE